MMMFRGNRMVLHTALAGAAAAGLAIAAAVTTQHPLQSPFPTADARAAALVDSGPVECPPPPPAVRDIDTVSKYGANRRENDSTIVNPADASKYAADTRPITDFTHRVSRFSDAALTHHATSSGDARCALQWMDAWAAKGALLGRMSDTGEAVRKWELGTLASAYLKIRKAPHDEAAAARVRRWLRQVAVAVRADYSRGTDRDSRSNNHLDWAAWAVMTAAIATDDRDLFGWSMDRFHYALGLISPDGTIPLEVKRRQLALSYHAFALGPLVMLREGAIDNGVKLSALEEQRLGALLDRVITGLSDPSYIAGKAGEDQDMAKVTDTQLAWLEPYYARSHDLRALQLLSARRPMTAPRLGGDLTALFAGPATQPRRPPDSEE